MTIAKAQVMALGAKDSRPETGANLILFGPPGGGKTHLAAAIGLRLIENGLIAKICNGGPVGQHPVRHSKPSLIDAPRQSTPKAILKPLRHTITIQITAQFSSRSPRYTPPYSGIKRDIEPNANVMKRWIRASASASVSPGRIGVMSRTKAPSLRPRVRLSTTTEAFAR